MSAEYIAISRMVRMVSGLVGGLGGWRAGRGQGVSGQLSSGADFERATALRRALARILLTNRSS